MIWLRRIISVPLVILFIALAIPAFSVFTSINILIEPDFIKQNLISNGVYETEFKRSLRRSVTETIDTWKDHLEYSAGQPLDIEIDSKKLAYAFERSIPMDVIEAETGRAIEEILSYMRRDQEEFDLGIDMTRIIESTLLNLVNISYKEEIVDLEIVSKGVTNSVINSDIDADIIAQSIPNEWLNNQIIEAIPEFVPYAAGQSETFSITVNLDGVFEEDSIIYIDGVANDALGRWYEYISDLLVESFINRSVAEPVEIDLFGVFSVGLSVDELRYIVNETVASKNLDDLIDSQSLDGLASYLMGSSDEFELSMDFGEVSSGAVDPTLDIIKAKLLNTASQGSAINSILEGAITVLVDQYRDPIEAVISDLIPHNLVISKHDLMADLSRTEGGMEILQSMENLRALLKEGFVYTDKELRSQLGPDGVVRLNQIRDLIKEASAYDEKDLSRHMMEYGKLDTGQIEGLRDILSNNTSRVLVMQLLSLILLVMIGLLVARDYINKIRAILLMGFVASLVMLAVVISVDSVLSNSIISLITDLETQIARREYEGDWTDLFVSSIVTEYTISTINIIDNFRIILVDEIKYFGVSCGLLTFALFVASHLVSRLGKQWKSA